MGFNPNFHIVPKNVGQISGLDDSHRPSFPAEKMYFPISIYTAESQEIPCW
jgi:hypothetical protein